jgi:oligopeptide/dipeptide ABC transporter ATP-binding protein
MPKLLECVHLKKFFQLGNHLVVKALDGVSLDLNQGETLGVVGESGCGKSTLARTLIRLYQPDEGQIFFEGKDIAKLQERDLTGVRRNFQMIFQDPYASLNPRMPIGEIIAEPLDVFREKKLIQISKKEIQKRAKELLELVGLSSHFSSRYPHEFSGGQRQRIGIARSLALSPKLLICDEPVSALDVSIQSQILNLLEKLQKELNLTYLFISHDLSVVRHIADRTAVMYLGKVVEIAPSKMIYEKPLHPYSKALLSDVPIPDPQKEKKRQRIILKGEVSSTHKRDKGCCFQDRCFLKTEICERIEPPLEEKENGHLSACHHYEKLL